MDDWTRQRVYALSDKGLSQRAIASELGVSRGAVWRALQRDKNSESQADQLEELDSAGPVYLGLALVWLVMLGIRFMRRTVSPANSVEPAPKPLGPARKTQLGRWIRLETGQVVWRGPRA